MSKFTFRVTLERAGEQEPIDGGTVNFEYEEYDGFGEAEALQEILPGGNSPEQLDLSLPGYIRWRGILMPASEFKALKVELIAKSI